MNIVQSWQQKKYQYISDTGLVSLMVPKENITSKEDHQRNNPMVIAF